MLVGLQLVMKAPVWALIARVDLVGGSTGYHRYKMVDNFIKKFGEWWLVGEQSTKHWGWMMDDTCQEYIQMGIRGGVLSLVLFIALFVFIFGITGRALKRYDYDFGLQHRFWALGVTAFTHLVAFFGIAYFDQSVFQLYFLFAVAASLENYYLNNQPASSP